MLNNIENKVESDDFSQIKRVENCAMCDAMAQLLCRVAQLFWWGERPREPFPEPIFHSTPNQTSVL
jgi:hypothetical protein